MTCQSNEWLCPWFWSRLSFDNCHYPRIQVVVLVRRKVAAINWLSALNRRLCNQFSSYHWHLIWLNSGVALCIHHSFFNFSPSVLSLSLSAILKVCALSLSLHQRRHSSLSLKRERGFHSVLKKKRKEKKTRDSVCTQSLAAPTAIPFGLSETWTAKSIRRRRTSGKYLVC